MKILLDVMSGDKAPLEIIRGGTMAAGDFDVDIVMIGNEQIIRQTASDNYIDISKDNISIVHASEVITMEDPALSIRTKKDSSMAVGLQMLAADEGDAFVSAGNTGALYAGASLIVYRIKGFRKAAIATVLPFETPMLLIDSGANIVVTDENITQFALMGSIYMEKLFGIVNPRVGLLNNGTEKTKGTQLLQDSYARLNECEAINFVGNVEGKQIPFSVCDVLVTDGFTGNVVLKLTEGLGSFLFKKLKGIFYKNVLTKMSAAMIKKDMSILKKDFDASEYGGAPILGISRPVIKAHGGSDALAIRNAVRQAIAYARNGVIVDIAHYAMKSSDCGFTES